MGLAPSLLMVGATIMGTFFALSIAPEQNKNRPMYTMLAFAGSGIMVTGFLLF